MKFTRILVGAGALIAAAGLGTAASAGSVQATASATAIISSPVTVTKTTDMSFGTIVRPSTGTSTVTLDTANNVTATGTATVGAGPRTSAKFTITAPGSSTYTPSTTFSVGTLANPVVGAPIVDAGSVGTMPASGPQVITYGGSFDVASTTAPATYTGSLVLTITYP